MGLYHCIHPAFMKDQLAQSLERLQLGYVDVLLLHNPEYYLTKHVDLSDKHDAQWHREEMKRRIKAVFVELEREVHRSGRIKSYGISSNSFSLPRSHHHFLAFRALIGMAEEAAVIATGNKTQVHS